MDFLSEYKELFYKEIEQSDRLNGKIPNNLMFLTIVGSGIIFLIQDVFPVEFG
jgi:hypothetical protein